MADAPIPPRLPENSALGITAMSDDGRHIGGFTLAAVSDLTYPSGAFVWTCA